MKETGCPVIQIILVTIVVIGVVWFFVRAFWLSSEPTGNAIGD